MKYAILLPLILVFALSCSDSGPVGAVIAEGEFEAGDYSYDWVPRYETDIVMPAGVYMLKFETENIEAELYFFLGQEDSGVGTDPVLKNAPLKKPIPDGYAFTIDKTHYQVGETIHIELALPVASRVKLSAIWTHLDFAPL